MEQKRVDIVNETGLHARPASQFVKAAAQFKSDITIQVDNNIINAKSIIGILGGGIVKDTSVLLQAEGEDEKEAIETLVHLISSGFGE